jgi:hypothetical protein
MSAEAQPPGQEGARLLSEKGEPAPADDEAYATAPRSVPYAEPKAKQNQRYRIDLNCVSTVDGPRTLFY